MASCRSRPSPPRARRQPIGLLRELPTDTWRVIYERALSDVLRTVEELAQDVDRLEGRVEQLEQRRRRR